MKQEGKKVGEKCKSAGYYRCSECDALQYFEEDDEFDACLSCGEENMIWIQED